VLYKLNDAGYHAYIVGGGVRDLLLGLQPKDFDIATDATPEQIHELFRNSRIIGRRFRIVHVHFGREVIEVSTFRALAADNVALVEGGLSRQESALDAVQSSSGMLLRDNVFGSIEEDVMRRDFTVNALYYTVRNFEVHDFVDGMADIDLRCLRMIGNPEQRYREDPVRVLRAMRLAAKLNFKLAPETEAPIAKCAKLLDSVSPARLFDEFMKLFFSGHGERTYGLLQQHQVFGILFPETNKALHDDSDGCFERLLCKGFGSTDERINAEKSVTPAFLLAVILWPAVDRLRKKLQEQGLSPLQSMHDAGESVLSRQLQQISIPRRFSLPMREIWDLQVRLTNRKGRRAELLLSHKRFRAAYDFLVLREASGEQLADLPAWWTEYQLANPDRQIELQATLQSDEQVPKRRKRRVKSRRNPPAPGNQ
jgi:poly(A) polymerase